MAKQSQIILDQLAGQGFFKSTIREYLDLIRKHQPISVFHEQLNRYLELDYEEGWTFVKEWAINNNFSVNEKRSFKHQLAALEGDLSNKEKLESEAAASLNSLKTKAREDVPVQVKTTLPTSLQKAEAIQRAQIQALEKRLFDPMTTFYYNSPLLKDIGNADLRLKAAAVLAAHPQVIAHYDPRQATAGRNHLSRATNQLQLVLSRAIPELTPLYYSLRSDEMEAKTEKTLADAKTELAKIYPGHSKDQINLKELDSDLVHFSGFIRTGSTLTDLSELIASIPPSYLTQDIGGLDQTIRQIVVRAASGTHVPGNELLAQLVRENKLSPQAALQLQFLAPRLELAELNIRSELSGHNLLDRTNTREKWSASLAASFGLNPATFWLKDKDLASATDRFLKEYGVASLEEAITKELATATTLDKYNQLTILHDQSAQRRQYHQARSGNTFFFLQDTLNKLGYGLQVTKEPYNRASRRFWSSLDKIDDTIHYPQRKLADFWEDLVDGRRRILGLKTVLEFKTKSGGLLRIPLLNLPGFVLDQLTIFRKNLALKVFEWSWKLGQKGGLFTPLKLVANYSFGFIQHDGDFRSTNFYFGRKAMGNFLDWGARQLKYKSFAAMKQWGAQGILKIGNKITGGLLGKTTAYLASLGLSVEGIGIFLTAAMLTIDVIKTIGGFFKKFFNDENFRNKFLNWAPAIGIFFGGLGTFLAGIPAAIAFGFSGLIAFLGTAISGIALFFIQGIIWVGAIVIGVMLFFQIFNTTTYLDSGPALQQVIAIAICDQSKLSISNATANVALCIAELADECPGVNPMTESAVKSQSWQCFVGGIVFKGAVAQLEQSSSVKNSTSAPEGNVQCVGLSAASAADGDGAFSVGQNNACSYATNVPSGYRYLPGCPDMQPGDHFIMGVDNCWSDKNPNGTVGHIGVVIEPGVGIGFSCVDANFSAPGQIRGPETGCVFANSQISGCLRKM